MEKYLEVQEKIENYENELQTWTDSLKELSEIEQAFETDRLHGKTILDIGTDCVKPLYIALKYEPEKITGINDDPYPFAADIAQNSKMLVKTKIEFYECNYFNDVKLKKILDRENQNESDFVVLSKTLHHLRTGDCIAKDREPEHICREDEKDCINNFNEQKIFKKLLGLGKRLIVYEGFYPGEPDNDKIRGRGGYFTLKEWTKTLRYLADNYKVELIKPIRCSIDKEEINNVITKLRQVDCICFYVEKKNF